MTAPFTRAAWFVLAALFVTPAALAEESSPPSMAAPPASATQEPPHDEPPARTLFRGKVDHGGFGAPAMKVTSVNGSVGLLVGVQGGWIVDHSLVLGIAGYGLATQSNAPAAMFVDGTESALELGYGGFRMGYLIEPKSLVHAGFGLLVGAGGVAALSRDELPNATGGRITYERKTDHADAFFVMEPEVEAELNVARFMRIALSASYRLASGVDAPGLRSSRVGGPAGGLALRFGSF